MYIAVSYTNWRPIKNSIGMVMNRLVVMGLNSIFVYVIYLKLTIAFCTTFILFCCIYVFLVTVDDQWLLVVHV